MSLKAAAAETREHGWFGYTTLIGGTGPNQLIGLAGHVKFKPTKSTTVIFAGEPKRRTHDAQPGSARRNVLQVRPRPARAGSDQAYLEDVDDSHEEPQEEVSRS